jgi:hypothetical protein
VLTHPDEQIARSQIRLYCVKRKASSTNEHNQNNVTIQRSGAVQSGGTTMIFIRGVIP